MNNWGWRPNYRKINFPALFSPPPPGGGGHYTLIATPGRASSRRNSKKGQKVTLQERKLTCVLLESREKQARTCDYEAYEGQDLGYADIQVVARNPKEVS